MMTTTLPTTVEQCIDWVKEKFTDSPLYFGHGTEHAVDEAVWLVTQQLDLQVEELEQTMGQTIKTDQFEAIRKLCETRIASKKPLAYLLNEAWFAGLKFYVDKRVIVPRSHIGEWIPEQFVPWIDPTDIKSILDLCTGSGCIAIALAHAFPDANIVATDICSKALGVAKLNVFAYELDHRIDLIESDLFADIGSSKFDLIVSNPPYVDPAIMATLPNEYRYEPKAALQSQLQGLAHIDAILSESIQFLNPNGWLILEAGSAVSALEKHHPKFPFTWMTSENGDSVVLCASKNELLCLHQLVA